jgi:tellurite resistance protein TerC
MVRTALAAGTVTGRKIVVAVLGATVLALGVVMIVLPGPAVLVIPLGLGILATEFAWARRWLERLRERGDRVLESLRGSPG